MKIAVWHNLPSGGGKRALYDQVRGLISRGHQIKAYLPPTAEEGFLPLAELCEVETVPLADKSARRSPLGIVEALVKGPRRFHEAMFEHSEKVAERIAADGADVIFLGACRQFFAPVIHPRMRELKPVLYLQEPNRPLYEVLPNARPVSPLYAEWMRVSERENARNVRKILCNSYFSRESILRAYGLEAEVCYLGIDLEKFVPGSDSLRRQVVSVGSLIPAKRPEFVLEVVSKLPVPRPKVVWIGNAQDAGYRAEVEALAQRLEVELEIRILVTDSELVEEIQASMATVYAPRLEPFGYGPLEANACGVPAIGFAEGGIRETVSSGVSGYLVTSSEEGAEALKRVLQNPTALRESSRQWAERWSLEEATTRLESHLSS